MQGMRRSNSSVECSKLTTRLAMKSSVESGWLPRLQGSNLVWRMELPVLCSDGTVERRHRAIGE